MSVIQDFEKFVLSQKPATEPWEPVTDFSAAARRSAEEPQAELIANVIKPQCVLDAGCGFGYLLGALRARNIQCYGVDLQARWPDAYDKKCARVDIASDTATLPAHWPKPDFVVSREVLEHLTVRQIHKTVRNLVKWTSKYVYVTTRFNTEPLHLFDVQAKDNLDPTHISMCPMDLLRLMFVLEGCKRCEGIERTLDWAGKKRVLVYEKVA